MMPTRASKLTYFAATLLGALCAGMSTQALAGLDLYATGSKISTGECVAAPSILRPNQVRCSGTLYGIRAQRADANRWVEFGVGNNGALLFWMNINGRLYTCAAPNTQGWKDAFVAATGSSAFFEMQLDPSTGECTSLFAATGSQFKSASAL
jgi:hypothetical protein